MGESDTGSLDFAFAGRGGYSSELDDSERKKTWRDDPLSAARSHGVDRHAKKSTSKREAWEARDHEEMKAQRHHLLSLNAYDRHKLLVNTYYLKQDGIEHLKRDASRDRNDLDVLKQEHRFLWDANDDDLAEGRWEVRLARRYYEKLYKEYAIVDLSRYQAQRNSIGLRWRVEREVVDGKGQFSCGERRCDEKDGLTTWEVNFGYVERGVKKNALVKLRLCAGCAPKLNYREKRRQVRVGKGEALKSKRRKQKGEKSRKKKKRPDNDDDDDDDQEDNETNDDEDEDEDKEEDSAPTDDGTDVWKASANVLADKTKEDEFDTYLEDMFL